MIPIAKKKLDKHSTTLSHMHTHYLFQQRNNKVKPTKRKVLNWLRARARETLKVAHR
jgi:hypothetical protein